MDTAGERVVIARLGRPHGVQGDIMAHADGPTLGTLEPGEHVAVRVGGVDRDLVLGDRRGEASKAILSFEGVNTREDASALTGGELVVAVARLPAISTADTFYVRDLLGYEVREGDRVLGVVSDIHPGPSNDSLVVRGPQGEVLVPFTMDAVIRVDEVARVLALRPDLLGEWAWGEAT